MDMRPDENYLAENYPGWSMQKAPVAGIAATNFAEAGAAEFADQSALDAAIDGIDSGALEAQSRAAIKPVLEMIARSADYAEVFDKLAETFPGMNTKLLEQTLARAMFTAEVWGRLSAQDEQS